MTEARAPRSRARRWAMLAAGAVALLALNIAVYAALQTAPAQQALDDLKGADYVGAFAIAFIANFTVLIPIPYNPVVVQLATAAPLPWLAALAGAAGSVLGEISGYLAGRSGAPLVEETRVAVWTRRQMERPGRAWLVLVAVSFPPNPLFDVAGLTAGALRVPYPVFFGSVMLGRSLRFLLLTYLALRFGS